MAKISIEDDDKIMDVSKPGKGKIVGTSRPVVAPITSDESTKQEDITEVSSVEQPEQPEQSSPSQTHKVIQPLHDQEPVSEQKSDEEPEQEPETKVVEPIAESSDSPTESSDAAGVNAIAESMSSKKEELKKAEEKAQKDSEIQTLIDGKKYIVPISKEGPGGTGKSSKYILIALLLFVLGVIVGYLLIDAKVIKLNISLPYEFFKEEANVTSSAEIGETLKQDAAIAKTEEAEETKEEQKLPDGYLEYTQDKLKFKFAYPQEWGKVDARENNGIYDNGLFLINISDNVKDKDMISVELRGESESKSYENSDSSYSKGFIKKGSTYYVKTSKNDGIEINKENLLGSYETDLGEVIVVKNVLGIGNGPTLNIYINFEQSEPIDGLVLTFAHSSDELTEGNDQFNSQDLEQIKQVAQTFKKI